MAAELPIPVSGSFDPYLNTQPEVEAKAEGERDELQEKEQHVQDLFRQIFSGANGAEALQYLRDHVDLEIGFNPAAGFHNGAAYGFARQGQKSIITHIEHLITASRERT